MGWQFSVPRSGLALPKRNHLALTAAGVVLVQTQREELDAEDTRVAKQLISAFATAARRPRPKVLAVSTASATGSVAKTTLATTAKGITAAKPTQRSGRRSAVVTRTGRERSVDMWRCSRADG